MTANKIESSRVGWKIQGLDCLLHKNAPNFMELDVL